MPHRFEEPIEDEDTLRLAGAGERARRERELPPRSAGRGGEPDRRTWQPLALGIAAALIILSGMNLAFTLADRPPLVRVKVTTAQASATHTLLPLVFATATHHAKASATPAPLPTLPPPPPTPAPVVPLPPDLPLPTFCPPATPTPTPAPGTATITPATSTPRPTPTPNCVACPWQFSSQSYTTAQVQTALINAAQRYHLPRNLVFGVARLESGWNPYFISCSDDIGLMQLKWGMWQSMDELDVPECGLTPTTYSPYKLQENAYLGAKVLAWLTCFFSYWGGTSGASLANPGNGTIAWYYAQAHLPYPDVALANGQTNPKSFCAAVYRNPNNPAYPALSATVRQTWSCPYTATTGDSTLLDVVLSSYNQGIGTTINSGIQNQWYVNIVEAIIAQYGQQDGAG